MGEKKAIPISLPINSNIGIAAIVRWYYQYSESPVNVSMSLSICSPMHLSISFA